MLKKIEHFFGLQKPEYRKQKIDFQRVFRICYLCAVICTLGVFSARAETLDLEAAVITGENSIDFGNLRSLDLSGEPIGDAAVRQVRISVVSDLGRPYIITQMLQDRPTNSNGAPLEDPGVRFSVSVEQGRGLVRVGSLEPLKPGAQEIYISSDNEEQTVLLITYDFVVPPGQKAGRYQGIVSYRVDSR